MRLIFPAAGDPGAPVHSAQPDERLVLASAAGEIELDAGCRFLRVLTGLDLGAAHAGEADHREWLQGALLARLQNTPFAGCNRVVDAVPADGTDRVALMLTVCNPDHQVTTVARAPAQFWVDFLQRAEWMRERLTLMEFDRLESVFPVTVARHVLTLARLDELAAGDIVVPSVSLFGCNGEGRLDLGRMRLRVQFREPGMLDVTGVEEKVDANDFESRHEPAALEETAAATQDPVEVAMPEPERERSAVDSLPVTLDFLLGRVRLSVGTLRELGPGSVLELEEGSPAAISIHAGGRRLGLGEAVDIDGRLGVRVLQWGRE